MPRAASGTTARTRRRRSAPALAFDKQLILNQYMLSLFGVSSFEELTAGMKSIQMEGLDEDNISYFHRHLTARTLEYPSLSRDQLLAYDQNIVHHTFAIQERREQPIVWKYFQYLSLLFTEIYLDQYFRDPITLRDILNVTVGQFNEAQEEGNRIPPYTLDDLNKLAFWNATGSGKTLLMHVNVHQYQYYVNKHKKNHQLNRIILLTPNEGLSQQHLKEFNDSGIHAVIFNKDDYSLFRGNAVEIIEVTKLKDESGDKTVAVDAFEGNNLVLVDEGHRGSSGEDWKNKRNKLCETGFSFEYSATFGQAVKAANKVELKNEYAKCILFDYSYKFFYKDGYGKDYKILNLASDDDERQRHLYLTACLLAFYQQRKLFVDKEREFTPFNLENPLWVFVGGSVTKSLSKKDETDVITILRFFARFVQAQQESIENLDRLISGSPGLLNERGHEIFVGNTFKHVLTTGLTGQVLFKDILKVVFNCLVPGSKLHVENLKGIDGEIALSLGNSEPFGVINIGSDAEFCKKCDSFQDEMVVGEKDFSASLFRNLHRNDSLVNVLIGSRKFTEGWNSYRVSTMGLMHIGKNEGSQIIQLFGRGVRLKGKRNERTNAYSLKRTRMLDDLSIRDIPEDIEILETLNVFGIEADYMKQFKEYLEEEGLPNNEEKVEFVLPVISDLGTKRLKVLKLKDGVDFKKQGPKPTLELPPTDVNFSVTVDWYPKLQAMQSITPVASMDFSSKEEAVLGQDHLAFLNIDEIFFELQEFKNERAWHNFNLSKEGVLHLLSNPSWYKLYIPRPEMAITRFDKVFLWQQIATTLLKKYCDRYYKHKKDEYERPLLEYRELSPDDPNFIQEYRFAIEETEQTLIQQLEQLKEAIESGDFSDFEFGVLFSFSFSQHLYKPLIHLKKGATIKVSPTHLNDGERGFVEDLKTFYESNKAYFDDKELYLLRNQSRGKGIGFFEANNFYPDFLLWLLVDGKQYVTFIDPKGIRNLEGPDDPKIRFYKTVKDIEERLRQSDSSIVLNSFIISNTPYSSVRWWLDKGEFESRNVLFQQEDKHTYIGRIFQTLDAD